MNRSRDCWGGGITFGRKRYLNRHKVWKVMVLELWRAEKDVEKKRVASSFISCFRPGLTTSNRGTILK